jgi:hypothetical protein
MKKICLLVLAGAGALFANVSNAGTNFAARVVAYEPGVNFVAGFTNAEAVLGDISRVNPFSDPVEPFNPPYGTGQILSIGEGGSVTIQFAQPVRNDPRHPFGVDFMVFGNSGFIITNDFDPNTFEWIGIPATDGSLLGANPGTTRVSVSRDGWRFYELVGAPTVDVLCPTDGAGDPTLASNPTLTAADFAGATTADIRAIYDGAAGGAGYDISSARDSKGRRAALSFIRFVRVEVLSGKAEVDAFSGVSCKKPH